MALPKKKKAGKNAEIRMPKETLVLENAESGEIVACKGKWRRIPNDGEPLRAFYTGEHREKYKDL